MRRRMGLWLLLLAASVVGSGCAYFNLFYNAQRAFAEAEQIGRDVDPRNQPTSQQRQQYQRAIRKCTDLLDEYPDSDLVDDALFLMGKSHLRLKEYSDAIRNFDNVLANFPSSEYVEETMYLKSLAHLSRGEEQVGLDWFARLRESFPEGRFGAEALFRLGDAYAEDDQNEQAIHYYEQFLEQYPRRPERARVEFSLARVLFDTGRTEAAIETLENFDPSLVSPDVAFEAAQLRVSALLEADRVEEAEARLEDLTRAVTNDNQRDQAQLLRGRVLLSLGRQEEGIEVMKSLAGARVGQPIASEALVIVVDHAAREFGPESEELAAAIAATEGVRLGGEWGQRVRNRSQQIQRYRNLRERVDAADSTSAKAAIDLAEIALFDFERPEDAVSWYGKVLDLGPDSPIAPRAAYAIGWIQAEMLGDESASESAFAVLVERYPESVQARALAGEEFRTAKERTPEQIAAMLAASGAGSGSTGQQGGDGSRPGDPRFDRYRSLRFGGPGAISPRGAGRP